MYLNVAWMYSMVICAVKETSQFRDIFRHIPSHVSWNEKDCFFHLLLNIWFSFSLQSSSVSPSASFRTGEKHRSSSDYSSDSKKQKTDDKELASTRYVSEQKCSDLFCDHAAFVLSYLLSYTFKISKLSLGSNIHHFRGGKKRGNPQPNKASMTDSMWRHRTWATFKLTLSFFFFERERDLTRQRS